MLPTVQSIQSIIMFELTKLKASQSNDFASQQSTVTTKNPHLAEMREDVLYHLGLSTSSHDIPFMFGDIKFVCMGGTPQRMEGFAHFIMQEIDFRLPTGTCLQDISRHSHRYSMYKIGPVLCVSHGMGVPSLSIVLHEVIKLLAHAGAKDPIFFRIGTCGGIGLAGGDVVVTKQAVDGLMRPVFETVILGKPVQRPTKVDSELVASLMDLGKLMDFKTFAGKTLCTNDFYEGQARIDGAFCVHGKEDKMNYLKTLEEAGVTNIEMESTCFAAMTHLANCRSAVVCVVLVDRLKGDQINATECLMKDWQRRPQRLVVAYIKEQLQIKTNLDMQVGHVGLGGYEDDRAN